MLKVVQLDSWEAFSLQSLEPPGSDAAGALICKMGTEPAWQLQAQWALSTSGPWPSAMGGHPSEIQG